MGAQEQTIRTSVTLLSCASTYGCGGRSEPVELRRTAQFMIVKKDEMLFVARRRSGSFLP